MRPQSYRQRLREIALDQYGFVTTTDAVASNIPPVELRKLALRGGLTNLARGLYRFDDIPVTPRDPFMEAVLWAGSEALLCGLAVLALHDLGQVNPRAIDVVTPRRVRRRLRRDVRIRHGVIPPEQRTRYFGIPSTTIEKALSDARSALTPERLHSSAEQAKAEGFLSDAQLEAILAGAIAHHA